MKLGCVKVIVLIYGIGSAISALMGTSLPIDIASILNLEREGN
jgi:hypothetical protein